MNDSFGSLVAVLKGDAEKKNVYNYHLATCEQRPQIIDDDRKVNVKMQGVMADVAAKKAAEEKAKKAFQCPFCEAKFKGENLGHLLKCAMKAEKAGGTGYKLKAYFSAKTS